MYTNEQIILAVKTQILETLPDADVILFGSRANNTAHDESDWDILVLADKAAITKSTRQILHDKLFPLSVSIGSFINLLLISRQDWLYNPSYYSLKKTVVQNNLLL